MTPVRVQWTLKKRIQKIEAGFLHLMILTGSHSLFSLSHPPLTNLYSSLCGCALVYHRSWNPDRTDDGRLYALGQNLFGQLGLGHSKNVPIPA